MRLAGRNGLGFDRKTSVAARAAEGQKIDRAHRLHFGARLETIEQLLEERLALPKTSVPGGWQSYPPCQQVRGLESRLDFLQSPKAFDHQPCADQQHQRESKLGDNQQAAQPQPAQTVGAAASHNTRWATFSQATASTRPTAPRSTNSAVRRLPTRSSCSERTVVLKPRG